MVVNRRQRVALFVGLALMLFNLVCPYTRFIPPPPSAALIQGPSTEAQQWRNLWDELSIEPKNGFRPIWLTADPFFFDYAPGTFLGETGVVWSVVAATVFGIALLTLIAVALLGEREWRRSTAAWTIGQLRSRCRFSIRGLMLAVVLVALGIQAIRLAQMSLKYHRQAVSYGAGQRWPGTGRTLSEDEIKTRDDWWKNQERKYHRAALRPWAPVEPDPPYPK
jgi:hypothetical protein